MGKTLRDRYRNAMATHGFGYALYEPEPFERLRPGTIGYFDDDSRWHPVLDLTDAAAVAALGCTPFVAPRLRSADTRRWDPLASNDVKENDMSLDAAVNGTSFGFPASVGVVTEYRTKTDFGAVLMCDSDVIVEGYDVRKPFERWVRENKVTLSKVEELRRHGIVCSTWTYSSESVHLTVWQNSENTVTVGCTAGAQGIASASAGRTWFRGRSGSSWTDWSDGKRVVFFTGIKCVYTWLGRMKTEPEGNWRGGDEFIVWDPDTWDCFEGEIESFGKDWAKAETEQIDEEDDENEVS
ncbi:hypothetical protein DER44DRAFT_801870 [Fusarium oxysporum]|nr:hypothetical protein DER44DRAFT_801870 [Fusarium oxysporum]